MSSIKIAIASIAAIGTLALGATAHASDKPSLSNCLKMQKQVNAAIGSHQQSAGLDKAKSEARAGREFCTTGLYKTGMQHYASALKLIGADARSQNTVN